MSISSIKRLRGILITSSALLAVSAGSALAQSIAAAEVETVTVTGSRISRPGFSQPTPVTAVNAEDLNKTAPITIADALNQLPQFGASPGSPTSSFQGGQNAGANFLNLRNLGATRTLVLLNGERIVSSTLTGTVDISNLPSTLIKRVDVVTGGASAAYGSNAVAGVVNLVLDTDYVGLKANVMGAISTYGDYPALKADAAVGTSFLGGKGHFVASVSFFNSPSLVVAGQRHWFNETELMNNPAYVAGNGQPRLIHENHVGLSQGTLGGLITAGPLKNVQFIGNGTPVPYNPGNVSGVLSYGGDGDMSLHDNYPLADPQKGYNFFGYTSYELASNLRLHVDLDYGHDGGWVASVPAIHFANITIQADNAFLPASIKTRMQQLGITSFQFGSTMGNLGTRVAAGSYFVNRVLQRAAFGLDGAFGGWTWNAYYQYGDVHFIERWFDDPYNPYLNQAIDSVIDPSTGAASCRSTLTSPGNGCVPLNVFGVGVASPQAKKYVSPVAWNQINNTQSVFSASIQGEPFSDWAGPVSVAAGGEYRRETAVSVSDPLSYTRQFFSGNTQPFNGSQDVKEGFVELVVPLAEDQDWAKSLEFNGAARVTDYSTSGTVETWKLGITYQVTSEYRLRGTWSNDIRAPNLSELFTSASSGTSIVTDPFRAGASSTVLATTKGNLNLTPEIADTVSGGVVLTPAWLPGFTASLDWYSITIKKAIASLSATNELADCFAGQTVLCQYIIRNTAGVITEIDTFPLNTARATTSGLDFEGDYTSEAWDGTLNLRLLGNYTDETTSTQNGVVIDNAGSIGFDTIGAPGVPKLKATLSATYDIDAFSGTVQSRVFGPARLNNAWGPLDVDDNAIPPVAYLDLRGSYGFGEGQAMQLYFAVDNALDTPPPAVPRSSTATNPQASLATRADIYDILGRYYRVGVRAKF